MEFLKENISKISQGKYIKGPLSRFLRDYRIYKVHACIMLLLYKVKYILSIRFGTFVVNISASVYARCHKETRGAS